MLPNLREINLDSCNDLVGLPEWLCDLEQLRKLSISNCHKPSELPEGIGRLENLQLLRHHACTKLLEFPETIGSLQKLREENMKELRETFCDLSHPNAVVHKTTGISRNNWKPPEVERIKYEGVEINFL